MSKYIRKADYIAMYGEEAWETYRESGRKYYKANRERHTKKMKQYYQDNKERILERNRQYCQEHKEEIAERMKQYYQDNREHRTEYQKQWCQDNKDHLADYKKQYYSTQFGRANYLKNGYNQSDKNRGFSTDQNVDEDWIIENIFKSQCIYCGESDWRELGCDRIDNTKPHAPDNVVCACGKCNVGRNNRYSVEDFQKRSIK